MQLNFLHIACIIAIFQAVLMSVYLITDKRNNKISKIILAVWFFIFAVILCCSFLVSYKIWQYFVDYHKTIFMIGQLSFLTGPLFYIYIVSLLDEKFVLKPVHSIHLLPLLMITSYIIITFVSIPRFVIWGTFLDFFCDGTYLIQNLIYFILTLKILKSHGLTVKTFFSYINNIQMIWIRLLVGGYIVIWIAKFQSFFFWIYSRDGSWCSYTATAYFMATFIFLNTIVFFALKKPEFFSRNKKYENSLLSDVDKKHYKDQLISYMENTKPYLNMTLNLTDLANELSIPARYLSQVINDSFQKNFYDFINIYRIEECKRILNDPHSGNKNILEIAYESGFNTKATFNSAFKKFTGLTPKQYRNNKSEIKTFV
jgi:AraC-like DNA-binding protein